MPKLVREIREMTRNMSLAGTSGLRAAEIVLFRDYI